MKLFNPATRKMLPLAIFLVLISVSVGFWVQFRFVLNNAQNRVLKPEHYEVQLVTAEEYRQISDPTVKNVPLSDGSTMSKFDAYVPTGYKPTPTKDQYVLVTTNGTAHIIPYAEPYFVLFGFLACCGFMACIWSPEANRQ